MQSARDDILALFYDEASDLLEKWERSALAFEKTGESRHMNAVLRSAHSLKGSALALGFEAYGAFVHAFEAEINRCRSSRLKHPWKLVPLLLEAKHILFEWTYQLDSNPGARPNTRDYLKRLDTIVSRLTDSPTLISAPSLRRAEKSAVSQKQSLKLSAQQLELIHRQWEKLFSQLTLASKQSKKPQPNALALRKRLRKLAHSANRLRDMIHGEKSVPIGMVFSRLEMLAHEIAKAQSKLIEVKKINELIQLPGELRKPVFESLLHLVRNAVDHGLESMEKRLACGKSETGQLVLMAKQLSKGFCIGVRDDGTGFQKQSILEHAQKRKLVSKNTSSLSCAELLQVITTPGFSTATSISPYSGRGLGMDIVSETLSQLGGTLRIETEHGEGSTVYLEFPDPSHLK